MVMLNVTTGRGKKVKDICLTSRYLCNIYRTTFPPARLARNAAATVYPTLNMCTRYPLLLGGQRQCRFKACPRHITGAVEIKPKTPRSRVQSPNHSLEYIIIHVSIGLKISLSVLFVFIESNHRSVCLSKSMKFATLLKYG